MPRIERSAPPTIRRGPRQKVLIVPLDFLSSHIDLLLRRNLFQPVQGHLNLRYANKSILKMKIIPMFVASTKTLLGWLSDSSLIRLQLLSLWSRQQPLQLPPLLLRRVRPQTIYLHLDPDKVSSSYMPKYHMNGNIGNGAGTTSSTRLNIQQSSQERKISRLKQNYIHAHAKKLRSLVFNPATPGLMATCALDGCIKVWNLASAQSYA